MSLTKCRWCQDQHICHITDDEDPGQMLYERLQREWKHGNIGWPGTAKPWPEEATLMPWDELTAREQEEWTRIANA